MFGFLSKAFVKLIGGTRNERITRAKLSYVRERINPLEREMRALSDEQLRAKSDELRSRRAGGESRERIKPEAFALIREASWRAQKHRHFDVQLVAGLILDDGWIAEEATGEGKTIACYPAVYMAVLEGMHVHVVTPNDYLVKVGAEFARPVFDMLGVTVGYITSDMPSFGDGAEQRRRAYACDVTYGMNSEFGFDYLRDNMKLSVADQVQGSLDFAIVDEVDSILIDEARTPLIISGMSHGETGRYKQADDVAREVIRRNRPWEQANQRVESLKRQVKALEGELDKAGKGDETRRKARQQLDETRRKLEDAERDLAERTKLYEVELDRKSVHMTHEGIGVAQEIAGVGSFYVGSNMEWPHLMEQALCARLVRERDKDYVVQDGRVVIVDEFTGRLLEGREWADGLHQAIEAKENVPIKQETQTEGTITYQNFFKLYTKLAGMTGTAMTEAAEFAKFYKLDCVSVPTNRPVNRVDHDDRIYGEVEGKYKALVEEVNRVSKQGRPVLVGTTSIDKSEKISTMLQRTYGLEHEVLNGRVENATRESLIVAKAGQQSPLKQGSDQMVGNVTIATNMAGRGTDIRLGEGVVYSKCKVPSDEQLRDMGLEPDPLYPAGVTKCCIHCEQYDPSTNCAHCFKPKLDSDFPTRGRTACRQEVPCGLHIVGTERHEARRIDNQLRGRAGRQGDPGSSRFFVSIRDDLMAVFAGPWTLKVLGWLGLQGDQSIEHKRVSKGIERAQRKVEERNFETRKNLLEYDEVMDYQRREYYAQRQQALEGRGLERLVLDFVHTSISEAVATYLGGDYAKRCMAEWARQQLQVPVEPEQIDAETLDDLDTLERDLRDRAKDEAATTISITLGEYMDEDLDRREWDLKGLSSWAMSRFGVNLSQNKLRNMSPPDVEEQLTAAARERIDAIDLDPIGTYLAEGFAGDALAEWASARFEIDVTAEHVSGESPDVEAWLIERVDAAYRRREIEYPVEYAMEMTLGQGGPDNVYAFNNLAEWANRKYDADLSGESLRAMDAGAIRRHLVELSEAWLTGDRLDTCIRDSVGASPDPEPAAQLAAERFDTTLEPDDLGDDVFAALREAGRRFLRREMTELERFVLLQILDSSWKDHLLAMDHLKSGIGLRSYAEQDPRVAYKREGSRLFTEMLEGVREKVADTIFKVRLTAEARMQSVYQVSNMVHEQLSAYDTVTQQMDRQQTGGPTKASTIVREQPKVGRNDPCPCGSGKKYKKCCGKNA